MQQVSAELRSMGPSERDHYHQLFESIGFGLNGREVTADFLRRSGLPQETLQFIWGQTAKNNGTFLDFDGFCAACRLVAHAQQRGPHSISPALVAETPAGPPWFDDKPAGAGHRPPPEKIKPLTSQAPPRNRQRGGNVMTNIPPGPATDFDFEDTAFGFDGGMGRPSGPPESTSQFGGAAAQSVPGSRRELTAQTRDLGLSNASFMQVDTGSLDFLLGEEGGAESAQKMSETIPLEADRVDHPGRDAAYSRLGRELVQRRKEFEKKFAERSNLEERVEKGRLELETLIESRRSATVEFSSQQAEVERLFQILNYNREFMAELQHDVATLHDSRAAVSEEELAQVKAKIALRDQDAGNAAEFWPPKPVAHNIPGLQEKVGRLLRKKMDLQARQQLTFALQQKAERERSDAWHALEVERKKFASLRSERFNAVQRRVTAEEEVVRVSREMGLDDEIIKQLLGRFPRFAAPTVHASTAEVSGEPQLNRELETPPTPQVETWWRSMLHLAGGEIAGKTAEVAGTKFPAPQPLNSPVGDRDIAHGASSEQNRNRRTRSVC